MFSHRSYQDGQHCHGTENLLIFFEHLYFLRLRQWSIRVNTFSNQWIGSEQMNVVFIIITASIEHRMKGRQTIRCVCVLKCSFRCYWWIFFTLVIATVFFQCYSPQNKWSRSFIRSDSEFRMSNSAKSRYELHSK